MRISVIGLGKLGAPLAAVLASTRRHVVVGVDTQPDPVRLLQGGLAPVQEPGLQALLDTIAGRLTATTCASDAIRTSDLTLICVPTPAAADGLLDHEPVLAAVRQVGYALRDLPDYHVVGVVSTLLPGTTDGPIRRALEETSQRRVGHDLGLGYTPVFVALGNVIRDLQNPEFILVGESDPKAGGVLARIYEDMCDYRPPIRRMQPVNAEIAKLSINTFLTTRIAYANMLADICERLPGADVDVVTDAIGLDTRIGAGYLKAAVGYGGPCFPRDNIALGALAHRLGARADVADATDRLNRYQVDRLVRHVREHAGAGSTVGILGLTYKPDTPVVEASFGIALANCLAANGHRVCASDPMGLEAARDVLGPEVELASAAACASQADVLVIATPWPEYARLDRRLLRRTARRCVVIDCWRLLPAEHFRDVAEVLYLGVGALPDVHV
jgi:UDPglucose 6-dehydrogenase